MGFILVWIESLAALLLLTAAGVALAARWRWRRAFLAALPAVAPAVAAGGFAVWGGSRALAHGGGLGDSANIGILVWGLAALLSTLVVLAVGLRHAGAPAAPAARAWPRRALALSAVVAGLLVVVTLWTMGNGLAARVAALRAEAGTLALHAAAARLPEHENAAPFYEAAADLIAPAPDEPANLRARLDSWLDPAAPPPAGPEATAYLARRTGGLELVRQAVARPGCLFDPVPGRHFDACAAVGHVRAAAELLTVHARAAAAAGDARTALLDVAGLLQIARHTALTPDATAVLTAAGLEARARLTLDEVLTRTTPSAADLAPVRAAGLVFYRAALRRALQAEQALVYGRLAGIAEEATGYGLLFLDAELQANALLFAVMQRELNEPYPQCLAAWARLEENAFPGDRGPPLTRLAAQAYARLLPLTARAEAERRVGQLAIAVAARRAETGELPQRVEDLAGAPVPADPFTGRPLKLAATAEGVIVSSVGPDGKDDLRVRVKK